MNRVSAAIIVALIGASPMAGDAREGGKRTPQDEALLGPLERDQSAQAVPCFNRPPKRDEKYAAAVVASNTAKRALSQAIKSGQGLIKLKKTCPTIEGRLVTEYFIVNQGKMSWIQDSTQDPLGGGAVAYPVSEAELGYFESMEEDREWHATDEPPEGTPVMLRFMFVRDSGPSMGEF
jgi:hypothetical protein